MVKRRVQVAVQNLRIGDEVADFGFIAKIEFTDNVSRTLTSTAQAAMQVSEFKRVSVWRDHRMATNQSGRPRTVDWDERAEELSFLLDAGESPERAMARVNPKLKPISWVRGLHTAGYKELSKLCKT